MNKKENGTAALKTEDILERAFGAALKHLPQEVKRKVSVLHAFVISCSALTQESDATGHDARKALEERRRETVAAIRDTASAQNKAVKDFAKLARENSIPELEIHAFFDALATETYKKNYKDMHELDTLFRGTAGALSVMFLHAVQSETSTEKKMRDEIALKKNLRELAEAFMLTDMMLSARKERIKNKKTYLPQSVFDRHSASATDLEKKEITPALRKVIRDNVLRARERYHDGAAAIKMLDKSLRFGLVLAISYGVRALDKIEQNDYDIISGKVIFGKLERKLFEAKIKYRYKIRKQSELRSAGLTLHK